MALIGICSTDSYIKFTYQGSQVGKAKISAGTCSLSGTLTGTASWVTSSTPNCKIDNSKIVYKLVISATGYDSLGKAPDGTATITINPDTCNSKFNGEYPLRKGNTGNGTTTQISKEYPYPVISWSSILIATIDDLSQSSVSTD